MVTYGTDILSMLPIDPLDETVSLEGGLNSKGQQTTKLRQYGYSTSSKQYVEQNRRKSSPKQQQKPRQSFETDSTLFTIKGGNEENGKQNQFAKEFTISNDVQTLLKGKSPMGFEGERVVVRRTSTNDSSSSNSTHSSSSHSNNRFKSFLKKFNGGNEKSKQQGKSTS